MPFFDATSIRVRLDIWEKWCIVPCVQDSRVPSLVLPTSDYEQMLTMSNRRLICVLRTAVLAPDRVARFSPRPPVEHDAYLVRHEPGRIVVRLYAEGREVFRCCFVRAEDEYRR